MSKRSRTIKKLMILVGLPGSGKTTFAKKFQDTYNGREIVKYVDLDMISQMKRYQRVEGFSLFEKAVNSGYASYLYGISYDSSIVIIDGLVTKSSEYSLIIRSYMNVHNVKMVEFHYWYPDIESCIWNDRGRRVQSSEDTIKGITIDKPDVKVLKEEFDIPIHLEYHSVIRKPVYSVIAEENGIHLEDGKYLTSCSWCMGGTSWGWDGEKQPISAEEPSEFEELDDFLLKVAPTLTFLQYKKIRNTCVTMKEIESNDYYSDTTSGVWLCDMSKMFSLLEEWGYNLEV